LNTGLIDLEFKAGGTKNPGTFKRNGSKIQFVVCVLHKPKLLIFDEPFSGFDPVNANIIKDEILALRDQGATIIFNT
jgi:ABC-2 type transport system ATP-binding protein